MERPTMISSNEPACTAIMLRGLSAHQTRDGFVKLLDKFGYRGLYTFVYVPMNFTDGQALGDAIVAFTKPASAIDFWHRVLASDELASCEASWNSVQGTKELV